VSRDAARLCYSPIHGGEATSIPEVLLFTIDAGGGHRAAASALVAAAQETGAPFRLRALSFQQTLLPLDVLKRATGVSREDAYNLILRRRANALMVPLLPCVRDLRQNAGHGPVRDSGGKRRWRCEARRCRNSIASTLSPSVGSISSCPPLCK